MMNRFYLACRSSNLAPLQGEGYEGVAAEGLDLSREVDEELSGRCPVEAPNQLIIDKDRLLDGVMQDAKASAQVAVVDTYPVANVEFDFESAIVKPEHESTLQAVATYLLENPDVKLLLEGHTDRVGGDAFNMTLSQSRAEAVKEQLVDRYGVSSDRLRVQGLGKTMLIPGVDNFQNRRVVFIVLAEDMTQYPLML